jgi:hypothetical protein
MRPWLLALRPALCAPFALCACDRSPARSSTAPPATTATPTPTPTATASATAPAFASASATAPAAPTVILAFQGTLGKQGEIRIALERTGEKLDGLAVIAGEEIELRGDVVGGRVTLTEAGAGRRGAVSFRGVLDGARLTGDWTDPKAKGPAALTAGPLDPFGPRPEATWAQQYVGTLGASTRVRAKLARRADGSLEGVYRYTRSKDDLRLSGKVTDADGRFELREQNASGAVTGSFAGVFLEKNFVFARWRSADGARTFPVRLRWATAYPEAEALAGGGRAVPQEDFSTPTKHCSLTFQFPTITGIPDKTRERSVNDALRAMAIGATPRECAGATAEYPFTAETTYAIRAQRKDLVGVRFQYYTYAGGAHGMHAVACAVADLGRGTLEKLTVPMLTAAGRAKLEARAQGELTKSGDTIMFPDRSTIKLSDETTLCVDGADLVVQFQVYEVGPYAIGAPEVRVPGREAHPLFTPSPLVDALFK